MHFSEKRKRKYFIWVVLALAVFAALYKSNLVPFPAFNKSSSFLHKFTHSNSQSVSQIYGGSLNSPNAILVRLSDGSVLMEKNSDDKIYPASLTKMMTAIVAIENLHSLDEHITMPSSMFNALYKADASMAGFLPGEKVKAEDLLYGILLPSGAECCIGIADYVSGSESAFVQKMNEKAKRLGMDNTHFVNATGLQDENHYTTVKDLSVLLRYAIKNSTFRKIFTTPRHSTAATNKHKNGITFSSTMFKKMKSTSVSGGRILGGKTGYTDEAGLCLASLAKIDGKDYILVTAGAKPGSSSQPYNISDAREVYNEIEH